MLCITVIMIVPPILIFLFAQKYIIEGTGGAIKWFKAEGIFSSKRIPFFDKIKKNGNRKKENEMAISISPNFKRISSLQWTDQLYYQVLENGQLGHVYFGKHLTDREDFGYLVEYATRDMAPYPFEGRSNFSLEHLKQEYGVYGSGELPHAAVDVLQGKRQQDLGSVLWRLWGSGRKAVSSGASGNLYGKWKRGGNIDPLPWG